MYFIFLENKSPGLHFAADNIGLSSLKFFWWAPEFLFTLARGRFRHSRASKVTDIGANRKRGYDFLLVRNSNLGPTPILHRFGARTCFMCSWPHPYSILILGGVPVAPDCSCWASTSTRALSYSAVKLFSKNSNVFEHGTWSLRTDGQTDRRTT